MHPSELPTSLQDPHPIRRAAWLTLAWCCLGLAVLGVVLPGLPTTPFVLLAAYAAARGSARMHAWLLAHRGFGPMIRDWQREGAVSPAAKRTATLLMLLCAALLLWLTPRWWMAALPCAVMLGVALWLWSRPNPGGSSVQHRDGAPPHACDHAARGDDDAPAQPRPAE